MEKKKTLIKIMLVPLLFVISLLTMDDTSNNNNYSTRGREISLYGSIITFLMYINEVFYYTITFACKCKCKSCQI